MLGFPSWMLTEGLLVGLQDEDLSKATQYRLKLSSWGSHVSLQNLNLSLQNILLLGEHPMVG